MRSFFFEKSIQSESQNFPSSVMQMNRMTLRMINILHLYFSPKMNGILLNFAKIFLILMTASCRLSFGSNQANFVQEIERNDIIYIF